MICSDFGRGFPSVLVSGIGGLDEAATLGRAGGAYRSDHLPRGGRAGVVASPGGRGGETDRGGCERSVPCGDGNEWWSGTWRRGESRTSACSTRSGPCPATSSCRPEPSGQAYDDESIPIGEGQTITPPYDVAFMTEVLDPKPTDVVYEVGTGSGYQSAILSRLVKEVYSVEIHKPLSERATKMQKRWDTRISTPESATATKVGPRRRRSTRSS